jgi:hypothetical protein
VVDVTCLWRQQTITSSGWRPAFTCSSGGSRFWLVRVSKFPHASFPSGASSSLNGFCVACNAELVFLMVFAAFSYYTYYWALQPFNQDYLEPYVLPHLKTLYTQALASYNAGGASSSVTAAANAS